MEVHAACQEDDRMLFFFAQAAVPRTAQRIAWQERRIKGLLEWCRIPLGCNQQERFGSPLVMSLVPSWL